MKVITLILFLVITTSVRAEVNFELDMTLDKIESSDEVCKIWENDGDDEIHITYINDDLDIWRYVKYNYEGDIIQTYSQSYADNYEFLNAKEFIIDENTYMIQCYKKTEALGIYEYNRYFVVELYDCDNYYSFIDSIEFFLGYCYELQEYDIMDISEIKYFDIDNIPIFHIGYKFYEYYWNFYDTSWSRYTDRTIKLGFNASLGFIEILDKAGYKLYDYPDVSTILSTAQYLYRWTTLGAGEEVKQFIIKKLSIDNPSVTIKQRTIQGNCNWDDFSGQFYFHYPEDSKFLTENDDFINTYGLIVYNKETDSSTGITPVYRCYSPTLDSILWVRNDTNIGIESIDATTCVSVNYENHYVMYFRNNLLEIRDRINGDIVLEETVDFIPSEILRDSSSTLLFCEETSTGFNIYKLEEEIQLSTSGHGMPIEDVKIYNFPNPFILSTNISFELKKSSLVEMKIYNIKGQLAANLIEAEMPFGSHTIEWISSDARPGIYFCKIKTDDHSYTKKMILMR